MHKKWMSLLLCGLLFGCGGQREEPTLQQVVESVAAASTMAGSPVDETPAPQALEAEREPLQIVEHIFQYSYAADEYELYMVFDREPQEDELHTEWDGSYFYTYELITYTGEVYASDVVVYAVQAAQYSKDINGYMVAAGGGSPYEVLPPREEAFYPENFESIAIWLYSDADETLACAYRYERPFTELGADMDTAWRLFCVSDGPRVMRLGLSPMYSQIEGDLEYEGFTPVDMDYGLTVNGLLGKSFKQFDGYAISLHEGAVGEPVQDENGEYWYEESQPVFVNCIVTSPDYALDCGIRVGLSMEDVVDILAAHNAYIREPLPIAEVTEGSAVRWNWVAYDFTGYDSVLTVPYLPLGGVGAGRALCLYFDEAGTLQCMTSSFVGAG